MILPGNILELGCFALGWAIHGHPELDFFVGWCTGDDLPDNSES
jgi:hypothetical protein